MADDVDALPPIPLQDVVSEALALAQEADTGAMAARFLARLQAWAAPSVVLGVVRDPAAETGWRVLPELTAGALPQGAERSLAKLFGEAPPDAPLRPTLVRPAEEVHGAKLRDTWVLPWAHAGASGFLVLRGIPQPYPPNLGDAVALLAQPLWPRLGVVQPIAAGPAPERGAALAALAAEAKRLAERAEAELGREQEHQAALEVVRKAQAEAQAQRGQAQADAAALHERLEVAGKETAYLRSRLEAAQAQAADASTRTTDLEARAHEREARVAESDRARAEAETERDRLKAEGSEGRARLEAGEKSAAEQRDRLQAAEKDATALRERLEAAERQSAEAKARVAELEAAPKGPEGGAPAEALEAARKQVAELETRAGQLSTQAADADKARAEAEAERDRARAEVTELRGRPDVDEKAALELRERLGAAEKDATALRERLEEAKKQAAEAKARVSELEEAPKAQAGGAPAEELEASRKQVAELETRVGQLSTRAGEAQKARAEGEAERDRARTEAADLRGRVEAIERQAHTDRSRADQERTAFEDRAVSAERAKAAAEVDRESLRAQANQLWASIESLQRQMKGDTERFDTERAQLGQARAAVEAERDEVKGTLATTVEKTLAAEKRAQDLAQRWEKTVAGFREAVQALRRTPFVPPTLRVTFGETEKLVEEPGRHRPTKLGRVLFLDRDTPGLERLATDLESAGIEVLIASYPEEVAFFLKTPEARQLSALVCDVMALRSDQDLASLVKAWRHELPGLMIFLSFKADNPAESEKAQRVPTTVTAGYLLRPLHSEALIEAVLPRRPGKR
jgi:hypothetical protein